MNRFDFGAFQNFLHMPSRAKYILHILLGPFQVTPRNMIHTCITFKTFLESNARFDGKQNDGIYRCNQQHESKSSGCDFLTIYPTELMIHLEWHACKDQPVDDSFKLKPTDETFTKHPAYKTTGIGMG